MTRSVLSPRGPEVAKKQFRINAKAAGMTFRAAAEARSLLPKPKPSVAPGMGRRTHGKMDQSYWNDRRGAFVHVGDDVEDHLVCPEGPDCEICNIEFEPPWVMGDDGLGREPQELVLASLLEIARPAKPKGLAKTFEIVDSVARVVVFDDDIWRHHDASRTLDDEDLWEEWDEAYGECEAVKKKPLYSAVVEGNAQLVDQQPENYHTCGDQLVVPGLW